MFVESLLCNELRRGFGSDFRDMRDHMGNEILKDSSSRKGPAPQGQMTPEGSSLSLCSYSAVAKWSEGARKRTINWGLENNRHAFSHSLEAGGPECRCIRRAVVPL